MKTRIMLAVLLISGIALMLHAQVIIPEWQPIVPGLLARSHTPNLTPDGQEPGMMDVLSAAGSVQVDNQMRLIQALKEWQAAHPQEFADTFARYELALQ